MVFLYCCVYGVLVLFLCYCILFYGVLVRFRGLVERRDWQCLQSLCGASAAAFLYKDHDSSIEDHDSSIEDHDSSIENDDFCDRCS